MQKITLTSDVFLIRWPLHLQTWTKLDFAAVGVFTALTMKYAAGFQERRGRERNMAPFTSWVVQSGQEVVKCFGSAPLSLTIKKDFPTKTQLTFIGFGHSGRDSSYVHLGKQKGKLGTVVE